MGDEGGRGVVVFAHWRVIAFPLYTFDLRLCAFNAYPNFNTFTIITSVRYTLEGVSDYCSRYRKLTFNSMIYSIEVISMGAPKSFHTPNYPTSYHNKYFFFHVYPLT